MTSTLQWHWHAVTLPCVIALFLGSDASCTTVARWPRSASDHYHGQRQHHHQYDMHPATQQLLNEPPGAHKELAGTYKNFLNCSTSKIILKNANTLYESPPIAPATPKPPSTDNLRKEILAIKDILSTLSKAVSAPSNPTP
ncbi:hypothetical protein BJV78DRAFT_1159190 [Lactifluus subvellereus]|nr:hypothetical protein BJV78DRAFT_1159190 [Lactifluus subvellereus]